MDVLKLLKKASGNEYASIASEGTIMDVHDYYDTGCYMLNAQLSADIFKGFPDNKRLCLSGLSKTGKTYLLIEILKNYLNQDENNYVLLFVSENTNDKKTLEERYIDTPRVLILPVKEVEDFNKQIWEELKTVQKIYKENKNVKILVALDSLGQIGSHKEFKELEKDIDKQKEDMTRAKRIRRLFRTIEMKMAYLRIPFLFTNHVYQKTDTFLNLECIAGGEGVMYASDIILAMKRKKLDGGVILKSHAFKNRHAKEETKIELLLNYNKGIDKYSGMFDFAVSCKMFNEKKKSVKKDQDAFEKYKELRNEDIEGKLYKYKDEYFTENDINNNPELFWTQEKLEHFNEYVKKYFAYGSEFNIENNNEEKVNE